MAERIAPGEVDDVPPRNSRSAADIVRANVFTRCNAITGVLFLIILAVGPIQDSLLGFVITANTGIGIVQELRAKRTLESLAVLGETRPRVRRGGRSTEVPTERIVLGDPVELRTGDKCVAAWSTASSRRPTASRWTSRCSPGRPTRCSNTPASR